MTFILDGVVLTNHEPFLLYHDEISVGTTTTSGVLTCMVGNSTPIWRDVSAAPLNTSSPLQSMPSGPGILRLSRTGALIPNDDQYNGLWSCIQQDSEAFGYIGIYNRGNNNNILSSLCTYHINSFVSQRYFYPCFHTGRGAIDQSTVTLNSSFMATPPTFTLYGDTGGGPPAVEYTWTRNGDVITNNDSYSISIDDAGQFTIERYYNAYYRSTLIVTSVLPGVYQYSVNNKATPCSVDRDFNLQGN